MSDTHQGRRPGMSATWHSVTCGALLVSIICTPVKAQQPTPLPQELVNEKNTRTGNTSFNGNLELQLRQVQGQDPADTDAQNDTGRLQATLELGLKHEFTNSAKLVAQLELRARQFTEDELNNSDDAFSYELERLYFEQSYLDKSYRWRLGRQAVDDVMNTVVDENLDGLRISVDQGNMEFDLSMTQQDLIEASTAERSDKITNVYATVELKPNDESVWMPYFLFRDQQAFGGDFAAKTSWFGIQGLIEPNPSWRYWLHLGAQQGKENTATEQFDLGGFVTDVGVNYRFDHHYKPTITLGLARATGGSTPANNRDERYRQSGLHSNSFKLNDRNSFRYLGEVVDPELTNIQILTVGFSAKFNKRWSSDVALHTYSQVELDDDIRGTDLEFEPDGISKDLGVAADVIVSFKPMKDLDLKAIVGVFEPGEAFEANQDQAVLGQLELEYDF